MADPRGLTTLIANPAAGRAALLERQLPAIEDLLHQHGYRLALLRTTAEPGSAAALARVAAAESALLLAAGGDGTVHGVIQGLTGAATVPLGVLPLGTANVLARNLSLPLDPLAAMARLLTCTPRRIPLGLAETAEGRRWFAVVAGCGPDGALVQALQPALKRRLRRSAYFVAAAGLLVSRRWPSFGVRYRLRGEAAWHQTEAVAMLAARVPDLGGLFSGLTRHCSLLGPMLEVSLLRAPAWAALPAWIAASLLRAPNPWLTQIEVEEIVCDGLPEVLCQADAESLGGLPLRLTLVPDALTLLMPR